jgi:hypothetical protein
MSEKVLVPILKRSGHIYKYGFSDLNGVILIDPVYDEVSPFKEGLAFVRVKDKWGCINENGQSVIPNTFDSVWKQFEDGLAVVEKNGYWGANNQNNHVVIPFLYSRPFTFEEGVAWATNKDSKAGLISRSNDVVVDFQFTDVIRSSMDRGTGRMI